MSIEFTFWCVGELCRGEDVVLEAENLTQDAVELAQLLLPWFPVSLRQILSFSATALFFQVHKRHATIGNAV